MFVTVEMQITHKSACKSSVFNCDAMRNTQNRLMNDLSSKAQREREHEKKIKKILKPFCTRH